MTKHLPFLQQAERMFELTQFLKEAGLKNKDMANTLGIYPSAFSSLINVVLKKILALKKDQRINDKMIGQIFEEVNNISELKTKRKLPEYIEKLESLKIQVLESPTQNNPNYVDTLINNSPSDILRLLEGIYYCYYVSSFNYNVKREPFLIQYDRNNNTYRVRKGNKLGPARYDGFGYVSNSNLFTIQMIEKNTLSVDNFLAHFHLPPMYAETLDMLKGISISMSNSNLPTSRKIILSRIDGLKSIEDFNAIETLFFEKDEAADNEIVSYLRAQPSFLEYLPIPYPTYNSEDLSKETKIKETLL